MTERTLEQEAEEYADEADSGWCAEGVHFNRADLKAAYLAGARREWVSVETRLPERSGIYQVWVAGADFADRAWYQASANAWHIGSCVSQRVTHWQSLPPAPEKEDEDAEADILAEHAKSVAPFIERRKKKIVL